MILFLIFLCFTICLLFYVIKAPGSWIPKFFLIFFSLYLSASVMFAVDNFKGWPYQGDIPEGHSEVLWAVVKEPNNRTGEKGSIYIWCYNIPENRPGLLDNFFLNFDPGENRVPRVFEIKYKRGNHEKIAQMMEELKKGQRVFIQTKKTDEEDGINIDIKSPELPPKQR